MTDIQKNIRENQDSKKEREKNSRIVEIKAMCIGAALILAGGAAGGYALNEVKAEREKAQAEAREQAEREKAADEQRKAMEEEEASKTPEEKTCNGMKDGDMLPTERVLSLPADAGPPVCPW